MVLRGWDGYFIVILLPKKCFQSLSLLTVFANSDLIVEQIL